jgi:hypothetical protein
LFQDAQALCERAAVLLVGNGATNEDLQEKYSDPKWKPPSFAYFQTLDNVTDHVPLSSLQQHEKTVKAEASSSKPSYNSSDSENKRKKKPGPKKKKLIKKKTTPKKKPVTRKKAKSEDSDEEETDEKEDESEFDDASESANEVDIPDQGKVYIPPEPRSHSLRTRRSQAKYVEDEDEEGFVEQEEDTVDSDNDFTD